MAAGFGEPYPPVAVGAGISVPAGAFVPDGCADPTCTVSAMSTHPDPFTVVDGTLPVPVIRPERFARNAGKFAVITIDAGRNVVLRSKKIVNEPAELGRHFAIFDGADPFT